MMKSSNGQREYKPGDVIVFNKTREQWGELSNMAAGFPLVVAGLEWLTSEALYQACRFPRLPDVQELLRVQKSPMAAKMKSKPHRSHTRPDWDAARLKVMRWVLRVKLAQNLDSFGAVLARTGQRPIVERSHKDRYWGAVLDECGILRGQNALGRLLMELREEANRLPRAEIEVVEAPVLDDFLISGKAVGTVRAGDRPDFPTRLF